MVHQHHRFELIGVQLDGTPVGNTTVDAWKDDQGAGHWSARVLMRADHGFRDAVLSGTTRDGRALHGPVRVAVDHPGPTGARTVLVELHGLGPLEG